MGEQTCGTCHYFDLIVVHEDDDSPADEATPTTICRRFPPSDGWQTVMEDDWCGEWEKNKR